jgi:hypothetical protein
MGETRDDLGLEIGCDLIERFGGGWGFRCGPGWLVEEEQ